MGVDSVRALAFTKRSTRKLAVRGVNPSSGRNVLADRQCTPSERVDSFDAVTHSAMAPWPMYPLDILLAHSLPVDITIIEPYDILRDPSLANRNPVWVLRDPGAVVWHHGFTVHQAAANRSRSHDRVFTIVYIASDATRTKSWPCYPLDREGLAVGEELSARACRSMATTCEPASSPEGIGDGTGPQTQRVG